MKRTMMAILMSLGALMSACSSSKPDELKADTPEQAVKWYQACWNSFNQQRWDDFKKCYSDNAASLQAGYGKLGATGPAMIVAASQDFVKTFPDARGEPQIILVNANHLASITLLKGTNSGPLRLPDGGELKGTNNRLGVLFGHFIEFDGPRVTKEVGAMDGISMENQLGLLKRPGRALIVGGAAAPQIVIAKNDAAEMKNLEAAKGELEAWNKHDAAAVANYVSDGAAFHDMTATGDQNKAARAETDKQYWTAFSNAKINASAMFAAGDFVAVAGTFDGTNDGEFPGMKLRKTGRTVSFPFVEVDRYESGKLAESWIMFDGAALLNQLGAQ